MASTYSDLKIELIATGEQSGSWGSTTNTNLGTAIEEAITGSATVSFSSADVTLTLSDTNGTQTARNLRLVCTGTSGGARNLILGSGCQIEKLYLIQNDLQDALTVKNTTGTGATVAAGEKKFVYNDGTNVVDAVTESINLTSEVTGTLPIANGGTNTTTTPTDGGVAYGTGSAYAFSTAGTSGYALISQGTGNAPTWQQVTNSNTVSTIVARDASGNFSAGTITASLSGNATNVSGTVALANGGTGATDAATARTNLGLGSMATQASNSVAITGGAVNTLTSLSCRGPNGVQGNTVMGESAAVSSTDPSVNNNTVFGFEAVTTASSARFLTAFGHMALRNTTTGDNSAFGFQALRFNTTGFQNTAVGNEAMENNLGGYENTALGHQALFANTSGRQNTALGTYSLITNQTGIGNVAVGHYALELNTANYNVGVGNQALGRNTTGFSNTAIGDAAGRGITTGYRNTAVGGSTLYGGTLTGIDNTGIGYGAGLNVTSGSQNTFLGSSAGSILQTGSNVTCLGYDAEPSTTSVSNQITLGNASVTSLRCNDTSISSLSDARDKTDIVDSPYGLSFVNTLQPRQFKWQTRDGNIKDGTTRLGFIAQELLAATDGKNDVLDLVYEDNPEKLEAKQGNLIPILVQAIKELSEKCDNLQAEVNNLKGG